MVKSDALVPSLSIVDNDVRVSLGVKARERLLSVSCGGMTMGLLKFFICEREKQNIQILRDKKNMVKSARSQHRERI